jgi:hypothetical protein
VAQIIEATGASPSRAYELRAAVLAALPTLVRPVGRPPAPPREAPPEATAALLSAVVTFLMDHPGCVSGSAARRRYADAFRHFVVELRERHADLEIEAFAEAVQVPLGTLKDWLRAGIEAPDGDGANGHEGDGDDDAEATPASTKIQAVLSCWKTWHGTFGGFCKHVREEQRIDFGPGTIADILYIHGARRPHRRPGRSPDERALEGAFKTFFAGAQWVGDGWQVPVSFNDLCFTFNVELLVDAASDAFVGLSIRDDEDSAAVTEALADGIDNTGEAPLALLLDNKPSNHTEEVDAALDDVTLRLRATESRPQNKAHVEGAFGLFQRTMPALDLRAHSPRDLCRRLLAFVVQTCARVYNHKPRTDRGGRTRVELYNEPVTAEQIDAARADLEARRKKQDLARVTRKARQEPVVRALLDDAFSRLGLADPEGHLRAAIARYGLDVVADAVAIFEAKKKAGTLPPAVDARYLLGIARNLADEREGLAIADELLRARLDARDRLLAPLLRARDAARAEVADARDRLLRFVDLALVAERGVDRAFWLLTIAEEINACAQGALASCVNAVARRVHATHRVPSRERHQAVRVIVGHLVPLN